MEQRQVVVTSFLCGHWPIFHGTPIQRIHHFLTFGAYDYFLRFIGYVFGTKGTDVILSVENFCCDRPNPILQLEFQPCRTKVLLKQQNSLLSHAFLCGKPDFQVARIYDFASAAALKASINGMSSERKPAESKWRAFFRRSPLEDVEVVVKNNVYDRGFLRNLCEIIFPFSSRSSFSQTKLKHG